MGKTKRIMAGIGSFFTEVVLDAIFLSFALYIIFPHAQWVYNHTEEPRLINVWGVFMSDWGVSKTAYIFGFTLLAIWLVVKWWRSRQDTKEHERLIQIMEKVAKLLEKLTEQK